MWANVLAESAAQATTVPKDGLYQRFMEGTAYGPQGGFRLQKSIDQRKIFGTNRASEGQPQSFGALLGVFKLFAGVVKAVDDPAGPSSGDCTDLNEHGHRYPVTFPLSRSGFRSPCSSADRRRHSIGTGQLLPRH